MGSTAAEEDADAGGYFWIRSGYRQGFEKRG